MGKNLNEEIEQVADIMEKSSKTLVEILKETIINLGPKGLRKALPTLSDEEKGLLKETLEDMRKAVSMDDQYAAKYIQGNINDTKLQEDKADDDQDEKLVKPEAAKMNHQGTPTPGWEGQVIKGEKPKKMFKEDAKDQIMDMEEKEHGTKDPKKLVEAEKKEHAQDKKSDGEQDLEKCGEMLMKEQGVPKGVDPKKQERCVRKLKGEPGKNAYAVCNAAMKKGESMSPETKQALIEIRKSVEEQLKEQGVEPTVELVKSEMRRLLQEEDQLGDAPDMEKEKTRADKKEPKEMELGEDNKDAQKKVNDLSQGSVKKAEEMTVEKKEDEKDPKDSEKKDEDKKKKMVKKAVWGGENDLIKANTGGRNHHFSVNGYYDEVLKEADATPEESVAKAESQKEDLNEIIAKGGDITWGDVETDKLLKANKAKINGKVFKSYEDNEIAEALGLSPEEAKKILGE